MTKNKHIIEKVFLEIDTTSITVANSIKGNANMFIQNELLPLVEAELNKFSLDEKEILQIENLSISVTNADLNIDSFSNLSFTNTFFKQEIENEIRQKLANIISKSRISTKTYEDTTSQNLFTEAKIILISDQNANTFIYYLLNGTLPWWSTNDEGINSQNKTNFTIDSIANFIKPKIFLSKLKEVISKKLVQQRLINQFSNEQLALIISVFRTLKSEKKLSRIQSNKLIQFLNERKDFALKKTFWEAIFHYLKENKPNIITALYFKNEQWFKNNSWDFEIFIDNLNDLIVFNHKVDKKELLEFENTTTNYKKALERVIEDEYQENNDLKEKSFYVQNAGLILLHPFIKELFKSCKLLENDNITLRDKELATHLLHYIAANKECDYEHSMLFEKFLCGLPIQFPIKREIIIPDEYKVEVEKMLKAASNHWGSLKSSSTNLLRNEFLQRQGKLDFRDSNPRLYIERKTQDILLDSIPWNISIVKIPWIENLIYTEW